MSVGSQRGMRGVYDSAPPRKRRPPDPVPLACIQRPGSGFPRVAFCPREPSAGEYMFQDPGHAAAVYGEGKTMRACPECVAVFRRESGK